MHSIPKGDDAGMTDEGRDDAMLDAMTDDLTWWHMEQMQYDWEMGIYNGGYEQ